VPRAVTAARDDDGAVPARCVQGLIEVDAFECSLAGGGEDVNVWALARQAAQNQVDRVLTRMTEGESSERAARGAGGITGAQRGDLRSDRVEDGLLGVVR